jgi:molecular chaperone DnaK
MIGIDLGTTKSCVAVMQGGIPQVIPSAEGPRTTPSAVSFAADGLLLFVGGPAKLYSRSSPENTITGVLRLVGRTFSSPEIQAARRVLPYRLVEAPGGDVHIQVGPEVYSPAQIASLVLRKLKTEAEGHLGEPVDEAVIAIPTCFNYWQRQVIRDAAHRAGLKFLRLINASSAAALAYTLKCTGRVGQIVAVCDLGGGTLDIAIVEISEGLCQVRATAGDTHLGGEDFDQKITDWLTAEFQGATRIDLAQDRTILARLKGAAEMAKCELSTRQQTEIVLPLIVPDASGPKHLNTVLTRQKCEELTGDLLEWAIDGCERCLVDAHMTPDQIDEVLLVGAQTRAPAVMEMVSRVFGKRPTRAVDLDEGVAMGAAIQAGIIHGKVMDLVLLDVTPHTLGIETKDGTFTPLVRRNSTIPTRRSRVFTTLTDDQTRVEVHILEGESEVVGRNVGLATLELEIPATPRGVRQVEVAFEIDLDGVVGVGVAEEASGRSQSMVIREVRPAEGFPQPVAATIGLPKGLTVMPVALDTIGIEAIDGTCTPLIRRNTRLPVGGSCVVSTTADSRRRVELHILEGESDVAAYNRSLARLELRDVPSSALGVSQVELTFEMGLDGTISVSARAPITGRGRSVSISPCGRLTYHDLGRSPEEESQVQGPMAFSNAATVEAWSLNPLVEQFRRGGVAREMRLMAAQGVLPLKPEDLVELWTNLVGDPDGAVRAAAEASLAGFPAASLQPILKSRDTPPGVLAWAVAHRREQELREIALQNTALPDEAVEAVARTLPQALAQLVLINQTRLRRRTSLFVALESNAGLNNDQRRRLRELRESFHIGEVEAAPPPVATLPPPPPLEPERELAPPSDVFLTEDQAVVTYLSEEERQQTEKVSAVQKIYRLNTAEKLITALKGSREERAILIRDPSRLVAMGVLGSPKITEAEIEAFSGMKNVSDQILRDIGNHREWTRRYQVVKNLVFNPRTPIDVALTLLPRLGPRDLRSLSVDRTVPEVVRGHAQEAADKSWREYVARGRDWAVAARRQLDAVVADTMRSVQSVESKLTPEERQSVLDAIQLAKGLKEDPDVRLRELKEALEDLEKAARLIGRATLRP